MGRFNFIKDEPVTVICIRTNGVEAWYQLKKGPSSWRLSGVVRGHYCPEYFEPELANLPEDREIIRELTLDEVQQITGSPFVKLLPPLPKGDECWCATLIGLSDFVPPSTGQPRKADHPEVGSPALPALETRPGGKCGSGSPASAFGDQPG